MVSALLHSFQQALDQREARSARRRLTVLPPDAVDFSSNDFLSLSSSSALRTRYLQTLKHHYASDPAPALGSGGSRLLDGNSAYAEDLERFIASFHHAPSGLLFNSGFDANVGVFSCIPQPGDVIVHDELIHASVHEGMRLSRAGRKVPFEHNSIGSLEKVLGELITDDASIVNGSRNVFVAVESLYSMDGDTAPIKDILQVTHRSLPRGNGYLIVDEAHATGVFGPQGAGVVQELGVQDQVFIRTHTFGKALAAQGAIVLCSPLTREYLINYARTLIYTTAMANPPLVAIRCAYDLMQAGETESCRSSLRANVESLRSRCEEELHRIIKPSVLRVDHHDRSPIFSVRTPWPRELARYCQQRGLIVRPIMSPTVPRGKERVRVCLHAGNTPAQIDRLVQTMAQWVQEQRSRDSKL